jgi:hypothetical protein
VPWPPDESRAIDTLEQIKMFHRAGIKIHLHYYCPGLHCHPTEVNRYCESIHPHRADLPEHLDDHSEANQSLLAELANDEFPVLFEGLHCPALLTKLSGLGRRIVIRMYDDECRHAAHLAKEEKHLIKKSKLKRVSGKMKAYEDALPQSASYVFTTDGNAKQFALDHQIPRVSFIPLLHPFSDITANPGVGNFCLYHGDLSDPYNEKAATWLLEKVFNDIKINFIVAGKVPGKRIRKLGHLFTLTCLIPNPSAEEINDLVAKAHINVLPSFSYKRPELKLIHSLHGGRHCIVNENAVGGTGLEAACFIADSVNAFKSAVLELHHKPFEAHEIELRERIFADDREDEELKFLKIIFD